MKGMLVAEKYRIGPKLGEGGMGAVYEAVNTTTGRRVAVKIIAESAKALPELLARFEREARAAGAIESQHIAQVLDAGVDATTKTPFMVMEHLDGEDLRALFERLGPLAPDLALRIVTQAALGLEKAHRAGFVHRDVKPANVFLAKRDAGERVVKVLDFGVAKVRVDPLSTREGDALTRTGSLVGSPRYMSPEQARGKKTLDHRADIWGLGAVLYELLGGTTPHEDADSLGELILMLCSKPVPSVRERATWVSPQVADIVDRCLATDPNDRYASMTELVRATSALLPDGWSIQEDMLAASPEAARAEPPPPDASRARLERANTTLTSTIPPPNEQPPGEAAPKEAISAVTAEGRNRGGVVLAIASVVVVAIGLVALGVASSREERTTDPRPARVAEPSAAVAPPPATASIDIGARVEASAVPSTTASAAPRIAPKPLRPAASAPVAPATSAPTKPEVPGLVKDTSEFGR